MNYLDLQATYNAYSSKLVDYLEFEEPIIDGNPMNTPLKFDISNRYIKNKKTYSRILTDLIYLEKIYREKYVRIIFLEDWRSYDKFKEKEDELVKTIKNNTVLNQKITELKTNYTNKLTTKIKALYYYFFVYQLYADFRSWIDIPFLYQQEKEYFIAFADNDGDYIGLINEAFEEAYESITLFDTTNTTDFLDVNRLEQEIDLVLSDCIETPRFKTEPKFYMLNYLQPYYFESKDPTVRIRRRDSNGLYSITDSKIRNDSRKTNATKKRNSIIKKYYVSKQTTPKLTVKKFIECNKIAESTFFYYKNQYDKNNSNNLK